MATTTIIPRPSASSPLSPIQGYVAYGDGNPATTTVISYHFEQYAGTQAWTAEYKAEFRAALSAIEAVANVTFVESGSASADLVEVIAPTSFFKSQNAWLPLHAIAQPLRRRLQHRLLDCRNKWKRRSGRVFLYYVAPRTGSRARVGSSPRHRFGYNRDEWRYIAI